MYRDRFASALAMVVMAAILVPSFLTAQTTFQRTYGGVNGDGGYSVRQTADGGYVIVGSTVSYGAGGSDVYLIKTNAVGDTQWTRTYGEAGSEHGLDVDQTFDGGYIVAAAKDGYWGPDVYIIRTNASGDTSWTRTFGETSDEDWADQVRQTTDSGFVVAGYTWFSDSFQSDIRVIKLDAGGHTQWNRTYGGPDQEYGYSVRQTNDRGYIVAGKTKSFGAGRLDMWLVKLDSVGDTLWTKTFGDTINDAASCVELAADGGYVLTGKANYLGVDEGDMCLLRTSSAGNLLWSGMYGGAGPEWGLSALQVDEGTYAVLGTTKSFGAGDRDFYLVKTDADGDTLWTRTFGGDSADDASSLLRATDGGYVMVGTTSSFGAGSADVWLIKTDSLGNVGVAEPRNNSMRMRSLTVNCEPNPCRGATTISFMPQASSSKPLTLRMYDSQGRMVLSRQVLTSSFPLSTSDLSSGAYFIRCDVADQHATARIVLQR